MYQAAAITKKLFPHILALLVAMVLGGSVAISLGQDQSWDLQNYHFYNPHAYLSHKDVTDISPDSPITYENPLSDVPSYLLITNLTPRTAGFALGAIQGLNVFLI